MTPQHKDKTVKRLTLGFTLILISITLLPINSVSATQAKYDGTKPMVTLSWDHAFLTQYQPMLEACQMHINGTVYVVTDRSINPNFMNWNQIHTIGNCGFEMASHSRIHLVETSLSASQLTSEIIKSKQDLTAQNFTTFGFIPPNGAINQTTFYNYIRPNYQYTMFIQGGLNNMTTITGTIKFNGEPILKGYTLGDLNPSQLGQISSYSQFLNVLHYAIIHKSWMIVHVHDILPDGSTNFRGYQAPTSSSFFNQTLNTIYQYQQNGTIITGTQCQGLGFC